MKLNFESIMRFSFTKYDKKKDAKTKTRKNLIFMPYVQNLKLNNVPRKIYPEHLVEPSFHHLKQPLPSVGNCKEKHHGSIFNEN